MIRHQFARSLVGCLLLTAAGILPAFAQYGDPGPLPRPRPYGDHGTIGPIGNPPIQYPNPNAPRPDPLTYWRSRIISNPGCGGTAIIINNGLPCYAPVYYGYGIGGYYSDSALSVGMSYGPMGFGYQQLQSGFGADPRQQLIFQRALAVRQAAQQAAEDHAAARAQTSQPQPDQQADRRGQSDPADTYYLSQKPKPQTALDRDPSLRQAVDDIQSAFRTGDIGRLERHVNPQDVLTLGSKGRTRKPLAGAAYLEMTREAVKTMKTVKYELGIVEPGSNGAMMVYGTHVLRAEDGSQRTFDVGFVLKKRGETWMISEISADPAR